MKRWRRFVGVLALAALLIGFGAIAVAQPDLGDFDRALSAIPLASHDRILTAIEGNLGSPGFPASELLSLINRVASLPAATDDRELILLLQTRALEGGMAIGGLVNVGFELASALGDGFPVEGVILEAFKGIAQRSPVSVIEAGIRRRLTLLGEVRDLLFVRGILRTPPGGSQSSPNALPAARFDELVVQIADALSDYLEGGGAPFDGDPPGQALYDLVADRLSRLPESLVHAADVDLVLDRIGPADLWQVALAALT